MRTDPITDQDWFAILDALPRVMAARKYGEEDYRQRATRQIEAALRLLWATGCHVSVVSKPTAHELRRRDTHDGPVAQWRRPKTRNWCVMPLTTPEADTLDWWLEQPRHPSRKYIWEVLCACARHAGLPGVTPLTIRHTVAFRVFHAAGPAAAKESLAVGDRALQHYTALSAGPRIAAIRAAREATNHA